MDLSARAVIDRLRERGSINAGQANRLTTAVFGGRDDATTLYADRRSPHRRRSMAAEHTVRITAVGILLLFLSPIAILLLVGDGTGDQILNWALVVLLVLAVPVISLLLIYDRLARIEEDLFDAWRGVEALLQDRAELVPMVLDSPSVDDAKAEQAIAALESATGIFSEVGRTIVRDAKTLDMLDETQRSLYEILLGLLTETGSEEQRKRLAENEQARADAKAAFDEAAITYNTAIRGLPGNLVAKIGRFRRAQRKNFRP